MTDDAYRVRHETGNAIHRLVRAAGGEFTDRPLLRSDPDGRKVPEPEPLAGITAAVAVEREARRLALESVRYAREDGLSWAQIAVALGFGAKTWADDPAVRAYRYAVPGHTAADWMTWTCPSCRKLIRDYGPEFSPHEAEQGHAEGCERFAAAIRARDAQWEDGEDG
jgi:hypothetical protein